LGLLFRLRTPVVLAMVSRGRFKAAFLLRGYVAGPRYPSPQQRIRIAQAGSWSRRQPGLVSMCITERLRKSTCTSSLSSLGSHFFWFPLVVFRGSLLSLSLSTPLQTPRHQHELAGVSFIRGHFMILPQFHTRFKKSMNRAGTTVRMEPLVFPVYQHTIPALRSSSKKRAK